VQIVRISRQLFNSVILLLFAAIVLACLFSLMLPPSASLLAPTATLTPTQTSSPVPTFTPTPTLPPTITRTPSPTFTRIPTQPITPAVTPFGSYTVYWQREVWKAAAGDFYFIEDFERDPVGFGFSNMPYLSGIGILVYGNGNPEVIPSPRIGSSGNMLHVRNGEQGFALTVPQSQDVKAFGFDYTAPEEWIATFGNFTLSLPAAESGFVGFVFHQDFPSEFRLSSSGNAQGGFALDNVSFVTFFMPVTPTMTPVPSQVTP
jgi:hypothetical protein